MLRPPPAIGRRKRAESSASSPSADGPVLVGAVFQPYEGATVTLTFDRAVDVDAYDGTAVGVTLVSPQQETTVFDGSGGASAVSDTSVVLALVVVSGPPPDQGDATMTVTAGNGIVAQDGGAWGGVSDLSLPFGQ